MWFGDVVRADIRRNLVMEVVSRVGERERVAILLERKTRDENYGSESAKSVLSVLLEQGFALEVGNKDF